MWGASVWPQLCSRSCVAFVVFPPGAYVLLKALLAGRLGGFGFYGSRWANLCGGSTVDVPRWTVLARGATFVEGSCRSAR